MKLTAIIEMSEGTTDKIYGDYYIKEKFKVKKQFKFKLECINCQKIKYLFDSNYYNNEGRNCYDCKLNLYVNKTFGFLTVIKLLDNNGYKNSFRYLTKCICGNERIALRKHLMYGTIKSCGCKGLKTVDILVGRKFNSYKDSAKRRNYIFDLSYNEFKTLILGNCYFCENPPKIKKFDLADDIAVFRKKEKIYLNGIDRVDNSISYNINNCVSCCSECNSKKGYVTVSIAKKLLNL